MAAIAGMVSCIIKDPEESNYPVILPEDNLRFSHAMELIVGKTSLSSRQYDKVRIMLRSYNIYMGSYSNMSSEIEMSVGHLVKNCSCSLCDKCAIILPNDILQMYMGQPKVMEALQFHPSLKILVRELKFSDPELYGGLNEDSNTLVLRFSLDNVGARKNRPMERVSMSLVNMIEQSDNSLLELAPRTWRDRKSKRI
jgi:hypothetical protein